MKKSNMIFGIVLVLIGLFFLSINFSIIPDLSFLEFFRNLWPLGFVLSGVLLIFRQRAFSLIVFILTVILGLLFVIVPELDSPDVEIVKKEIFYDYDFETNDVVYHISFGAGRFNLAKTFNESRLFEGSLESSTILGSSVNVTPSNGTTVVRLNRDEEMSFKKFIWTLGDDNLAADWDLRINDEPATSLDIDYGASNVFLDLRELNIDSLSIDCGASDTDIVFGNESVDVDISSGVADFNFEFTEDIGIVVKATGGLVDVNLDEFTRIDDRYYSPNYVQGEEKITISIDSGVTNINGRILQ